MWQFSMGDQDTLAEKSTFGQRRGASKLGPKGTSIPSRGQGGSPAQAPRLRAATAWPGGQCGALKRPGGGAGRRGPRAFYHGGFLSNF